MKEITASELIDKYDNFLLDAFGVIVNADGAIDHAKDFIKELEKKGKTYFILSNGSKYLASKSAVSYQSRGIPIPEDNVITSGSLLKDWFENNPNHRSAKVLGPESSTELVKWAGGKPITTEEYSTLVICNQDGFRFPEDVDAAISYIAKKARTSKPVKLVLPNPDLIYPSASGYGITSGAIAKIIESSLGIILGKDAPTFEMLGKPHKPIFDKVLSKLSGKTCMIGDQYETDILGANHAGISSVLVETGICKKLPERELAEGRVPKYILKNLSI
jgi:HAD superfamily hydrolase (TIGR01450 family)